MRDKCVADECKRIFKKNVKAKRATRNVKLSQYKWLLDILKEDGIRFGICQKCFTRYLKRRPRLDVSTDVTSTQPSGDQATPGVYVETDTSEINQNGNNVSSESCGQMEDVGNSSNLPFLLVDDLFYGNCSHQKCCLCLNYFKRNLLFLPKRARHQLIYWHRIWCCASSRVCSDHLIGKDLNPSKFRWEREIKFSVTY